MKKTLENIFMEWLLVKKWWMGFCLIAFFTILLVIGLQIQSHSKASSLMKYEAENGLTAGVSVATEATGF